MHYNDSLAAVFRLLFRSDAVSVSMAILGLCLGVVFLIVHDTLKSSYLAIGSLLLFLPTLHPWYLVLVTPFLVSVPVQGLALPACCHGFHLSGPCR